MQKLLLDEMMPVELRNGFPREWFVSTVDDEGWKHQDNGKLQRLAVAAGFTAMLTLDKSMRYQTPNPLMPVVIVSIRGQKAEDFAARIPLVVEFLSRSPAVGYHALSL